MSMIQVFHGRTHNFNSTTYTTLYSSIHGINEGDYLSYGYLASNDSSKFITVMPCSGTIKRVCGTTEGSDGHQYTVTLVKNGVDTLNTFNILIGTDYEVFSDSEVSFSAGDIFYFKFNFNVNYAYLAYLNFNIYFEFESNTSVLLGGISQVAYPGTSNNFCMIKGENGYSTDSTDNAVLCPLEGDITDLYVKLSSAIPTSSVTLEYTVYKNNLATGLTLTLSQGQSSGNISTLISVSPGDKIQLYAKRTNSVGGLSAYVGWGIKISPDINGEFPIVGFCPLSYTSFTNPTQYGFFYSCGNAVFNESNAIYFLKVYDNIKYYNLFLEMNQSPTDMGIPSIYFDLTDGSFSVSGFGCNYENNYIGFTVSGTNKTGNSGVQELTYNDAYTMQTIRMDVCYYPITVPKFWFGLVGYFEPVNPFGNADVIATRGCVNVHGTITSTLDHLEGKNVIILADGEVIEGRTVVGGALVPALDHSYASVTVGLPYDSDMITLGTER